MNFRHRIAAVSVVAALMILAVIAVLLANSRTEAWDRARQEIENVRKAVQEDARSQMMLYGTLLDAASSMLGGPHGATITGELTARLVEGMTHDNAAVGNIMIVDKNGNSRADAARLSKLTDNFADRPYFTVHRDRDDVGLFVSDPYESRISNGQLSYALSRRISDGKGQFAGVAVAALRLEHFKGLFSHIDLGPNGSVALIKQGGTVMMRQPSNDGSGDVGRDVSVGPAFERIQRTGEHSLIVTSPLDGVERLVSWAQVPGFPLYVVAAASTKTILQHWWHQTFAVAGFSIPMCGAIVFLAVLLQRRVNELELARDELSVLAATDGLTGLPNRREFDLAVHREWQRAIRSGLPLSLLIIDADHFKHINDRRGHLEGDKVLRKLAHLIRGGLNRGGDFAARYGGEEFAAVLPDTDAAAAQKLAEKIRSSVETWFADEKNNGRSAVTVSIGIASLLPSTATRIDQLLAAADSALYKAKNSGRNQTVAADIELQGDGVVVSFPRRHSAK